MIEDDRSSQFSAVVLPHLPDALTTALWLTGDRADAEDVVQEACLRAFRAVATFTGAMRALGARHCAQYCPFVDQKNRRVELVAVDDLETEERVQAERGANIEELISVNPEADLIARADEAHLREEIEKCQLNSAKHWSYATFRDLNIARLRNHFGTGGHRPLVWRVPGAAW
jgi:RNA polymerase sigma-70 factor (ECF subfamily)